MYFGVAWLIDGVEGMFPAPGGNLLAVGGSLEVGKLSRLLVECLACAWAARLLGVEKLLLMGAEAGMFCAGGPFG